jgi:hypothetical protein
MPRPRKKANKVKVSYRKAERSPGNRLPKPPKLEMREPKPQSALQKYVQENEGSELTVVELIQQFQEYDCEHEDVRDTVGPSKDSYTCIQCRRVRFVEKDQ